MLLFPSVVGAAAAAHVLAPLSSRQPRRLRTSLRARLPRKLRDSPNCLHLRIRTLTSKADCVFVHVGDVKIENASTSYLQTSTCSPLIQVVMVSWGVQFARCVVEILRGSGGPCGRRRRGRAHLPCRRERRQCGIGRRVPSVSKRPGGVFLVF